MLFDKCLTILRFNNHHLRIMLLDELSPILWFLTDDDVSRILEQGAKQTADPRRASTDNQDSILFRNFRYSRSPESSSKDVANEERLLIAYRIRNLVQAGCSIRNPHIFRLPAIDSASQSPSAMWRSTIVHVSMLAIEAFSTEGLYIHGYSVSRLHMGNPLPYFLYNAYHFVANSNPRYCARHRTMLDMKITGADTAQRYSYDGIMLIYYRRLPFFCEAKLSLLDICKCFHLNYIYKYYYSR